MNPALFGLMPSAMKATFTPAPSMPSAAAVLALGSSERTFIVCNASGSSIGLFGSVEQAPGSTGAGPTAACGVALGLAACGVGVDGGTTCTFWFGSTLATAGFAASWAAWAA